MMVYHTKRGAALMSFLIMVNSNPGEKRTVRTRPLALPLGELSPQVTERAIPPLVGALLQPSLSVLASLGHLSQRERQGGVAALGHLSRRESQERRVRPASSQKFIYIHKKEVKI